MIAMYEKKEGIYVGQIMHLNAKRYNENSFFFVSIHDPFNLVFVLKIHVDTNKFASSHLIGYKY